MDFLQKLSNCIKSLSTLRNKQPCQNICCYYGCHSYPTIKCNLKKFPPPPIHIFPVLPRFDHYPDSLIGVIHISIFRFINVFQKESSTTKLPSLGNSHLTKNGNVIFVRWIYLRIDCTPDHQLKSLPYDTFLFIICN